MYTKIILTFIFLFNSQSYGFSLFDSKLAVYSCESEAEAVKCASCTKNQGMVVEFQINTQSGIVIQQVYENGQSVASTNLEECKIVDKNNWQCGSTTNNQFAYMRSYQRMNKGKFNYLHEVDRPAVKIGALSLAASKYSSYSCAK